MRENFAGGKFGLLGRFPLEIATLFTITPTFHRATPERREIFLQKFLLHYVRRETKMFGNG